MPVFSLDAFDSKSNFHLICEGVQMQRRDVVETPRVGLTLKRLDEHRPGYWMADYRHLSHPELHSKMKDFIILSMIEKGLTATAIMAKANCKINKVEEMRADFEKGQKLDSTMAKQHKENMKASDWAHVYGLNKKLYKK